MSSRSYVPHPSLRQKHIPNHYLQLPFWAIVSFGAFLLAKLGYGVFSFNDVPEAHEELLQQIEQAKADLRKRKVSVD